MKKVSKILALLLALAMVLSFVACNKTPVEPESTTDEVLTTEEPTTAEPTTAEATTEEQPADESTTEPTTPASSTTEPSTGVTTTATTATTTTTTTTAPPKDLTTKEVLDLFNAATKKVVDQKAGYDKKRFTKITGIDFGLLGNLAIVKEAVYGFLGITDTATGEGTYTAKAEKGKASDLLQVSTLAEGDVKSAKAVSDGKGGYTITIEVKDGTTSWSGKGGTDPGSGTAKSAIDKGPLCYGIEDNEKFDHKNARLVYNAINGADGASTEGIRETTSGVKFTAKTDDQGRLTSLTGRMDMIVYVDHVKYTGITLRNKSGQGYGTIEYSNFKY
ncbi:MAG: hypothetical protein FWF05_04710 [Oscillospiraceae bacterium]|nr:hypothetical protein [Oscillospiraceae bacterium]